MVNVTRQRVKAWWRAHGEGVLASVARDGATVVDLPASIATTSEADARAAAAWLTERLPAGWTARVDPWPFTIYATRDNVLPLVGSLSP